MYLVILKCLKKYVYYMEISKYTVFLAKWLKEGCWDFILFYF